MPLHSTPTGSSWNRVLGGRPEPGVGLPYNLENDMGGEKTGPTQHYGWPDLIERPCRAQITIETRRSLASGAEPLAPPDEGPRLAEERS